MNYLPEIRILHRPNYFNKLIFSILGLMIFTSSTFGQKLDSIQISGIYENSPITSFLSEIENKYPVKFYYRTEWMQDINISKHFSNTSLRTALEQVFIETPYLIEYVQDAIIILPKEAVAFATGKMEILTNGFVSDKPVTIGKIKNESKLRKAVIKGIVTSVKENSPVAGVEIQVQNTKLGAISDQNGEYSIELPTGILNLIVNGVGYEETVITIKLISDGELDIQLPEKSIKIGEVVISAQRADRNVSSNQMSLVELDRKQIKQLPSTNGTKDILKNMTMIAGVKSVGEFGSDINVRGGGGDQNLYLIEGTPVFNTAHIFGLLSVINSDAISNVSLYKGDIPAGYGERISSLMNIEIKKDIPAKIHGFGGIGLIDSRLTLEAPIIKDKLSVLISGRSTYSDWLLKKIPDADLHSSRAQFYDVNGMINWNLNQNNKISLFIYNSSDNFKYADELDYSYGNFLGSVKWQHRLNQNLNSVLSFHLSNYEVNKKQTLNTFEKSNTRSNISYKSARLDFSFTKLKKHTLEWGLQTIFYKLNPGEINPSDLVSIVPSQKLNTEQANESAIYMVDKINLNNKISISAGLRISAYSYLGPSTIYNYDNEKTRSIYSITDSTIYGKNKAVSTFLGIEPRISFKYQISDESSLKINYNRNFQYISLISYTSVFTPDDRWKLSDPFLKPIQCNQIAMGYFRNFKQNKIETSVEIYYKKLKNLVEYKNGAEINMNPHIETELMAASGTNYGLEIAIKKSSGRLDTWLSYTWSRSMKKTNGQFSEETINQNTYYPSNFDKPHELNLFVNYHLNRRWRFSANFVYATGRPATLPEMKYQIGNDWAIYYSDRNKYRLPDYHRLDISINFDESLWLKKKWKSSWTFSVINVYGRNNAYSVFYKKDIPTVQNNFKMFSMNKLYIIGQPIPTITYNFIF